MELLQWEMKQLMEQYSLRCLENAALQERAEQQRHALQLSRQRSSTLMEKSVPFLFLRLIINYGSFIMGHLFASQK